MGVYVDNYGAKFGRMVMCHMMADTTAELLAMARKIGVAAKWIQCPGTPKEHFDICLSKRKIAIASGAVEVGWREIAALSSRAKIGDPIEIEKLPPPTEQLRLL